MFLIQVDNFYNYLPQHAKNHSVNTNHSFNNFDSNSIVKNINASLKPKCNVSSSESLSANLINKTNSTDSNWNLSNMNSNHSNTYSTQNDFNSDLTDSKQNANYVLPSIHNQHIVSTVDRFRSVLTNHRLSPYSTAYHNNSYTNSNNSLNYNQSTETDSNSSRPITSSPSSTSSSSLLSNSLNQFPSPSSNLIRDSLCF